MSLFKLNGDTAGQHVNPKKCKFYSGALSASKSEISLYLGFAPGEFPFNYLDVPIFKSKPNEICLRPIVNKIKMKL